MTTQVIFDTLSPSVQGQPGTAPKIFSGTTDQSLADITTAGAVSSYVSNLIFKPGDIVFVNCNVAGSPSTNGSQVQLTVTGTSGGSLVGYSAPQTVIQYASVPITLANFLAMYDAPVQLVPAAGANTLIVFKQLQIAQTYGSAALANGGVAAVQYDSTVHGAGVIASTTLSAATFQATASSVYTMNPGVVVLPFSTTVNKGLYLSCLSGDFTAGTASTFVANVWYSVMATA